MIRLSRSQSKIQSQVGNKKLLVLVHGWCRSPADLQPLADLLSKEKELENFDILSFGYGASFISNRRLDTVSAGLSTEIGIYHDDHDYEAIVLLGHSIGGLIARGAFLIAKGEASGHIKGYTHTWADQVGRIVLLAAPNRGSAYVERSWTGRQFFRAVTMLGQLKLIRDAFRGSVFITNLRIDWIRTMHHLKGKAPEIVQLLGEDDKEVAREDSEDVIQFRNAVHRMVAGEDHASIVKVRNREQPNYRLIYKYLTAPITSQEKEKQQRVAEKPDAVVFLVHGIRDYGEWLGRVQRMIHAEIPNSNFVVASYKYFSISQFLWKPARDRRVEIFRDQYTQALALYPDVPFHFVGHSFGTYILANSLKTFKSMRFHRVYFAGSVVPEDFDWDTCFDKGQILVIRNDCASKDYPVGFLCSALQVILSEDLGIGGFRGFHPGIHAAKFNQNRYFTGGHSAAIDQDANLASIAKFIAQDSINGDYPAPAGIMVDTISTKFSQLSKSAPILVPILGCIALSLLLLVAYFLRPYGAVLSVALLVFLLWRF